MDNKIALAALVIVLSLVNWSIFNKQQHLNNGKVVYLQLAPLDPRSLMQGDYMALRFQLAAEVSRALPKTKTVKHRPQIIDASDGHVVVALDNKKVASFKAIYKNQPLAENEMLLQYRVRNGQVKFATNAFFFQEGRANALQPARFGQFRVNNKGELLLAAMYNSEMEKL